jgi:aminoglycoside phosphotransferase (APT) family kinase protein
MLRSMDLTWISEAIGRFAREAIAPDAELAAVEPGAGHAGFSYLFDISTAGTLKRFYLRLPPPGVKWQGTADLTRQTTALRALDGSIVPHAEVLWSGDETSAFGVPFYVVPRIDGITLADPETIAGFDQATLSGAARQAMRALVEVHRVDWRERCGYLGGFTGLEHEITRWDRLAERAADRDELLALAPAVRQRLLETMPEEFDVGLFHGDFQFQNLMYARDGALLAVIDWELCGIGPTLNDLGWITAFHDKPAWGPVPRPSTAFADAAELKEWYFEALGRQQPHAEWFEALSLYKYAIITGFNLMLHRRGKRVDEAWEHRRPGAPCNLRHALTLLGAS